MKVLFSACLALIVVLSVTACSAGEGSVPIQSSAMAASAQSSASASADSLPTQTSGMTALSQNEAESTAGPDRIEEEKDEISDDIEAYAATFWPEQHSALPGEPGWAAETELDILSDALASLRLRSITKFIAVSRPNDQAIKKDLSPEEVASLIGALKEIRPSIFESPENPSTGGTIVCYIETADGITEIGFNGNWLMMSRSNDTNWWIFDASPCADQCYEIWGTIDKILSSEG